MLGILSGILQTTLGYVAQGGGGQGSLSPSSLRDITDRIALTNGHLSAAVTQWQD